MCQKASVKPMLHLSVLERVAHSTENYAPGNLPFGASVVFTPLRHHSLELLEQRAQKVEHVLHLVQTAGSLLPDVKGAIIAGMASYYIYLAVWTFVLISFTWGLLVALGVATPLISLLAVMAIVFGGFGVAYLMQFLADRRMLAVFSRFWHNEQPELREALKQARWAVKKKVA
jgi:hypothetical protein